MGVKDHTDGGAGRGHGGPRHRQRQRILELVREHDEALDAAELASETGLHMTTVRFHLDALCSEGVVERTRITRAGVGRPRTGYRPVRERLDYRSLAEMLALELGDTADKRRSRAAAIGRRWAKRIVANSAHIDAAPQEVSDSAGPGETLEDRATMVAAVFARMGFGPELTPAASSTTGDQRTIRLHECPIRDLARTHSEVACALHQGLLEGLLPDPIHAEVEPFVEPELCLARVIARD